MESTSLFSAPEGQPRRSAAAASPRPATNPFQAPDFGEEDLFLAEDEVLEPGPGAQHFRVA
ncbi:hypothetical protein AQJ30_16790 [Streptomyces longwoodensis]|uniref:Uncharacterized protein n=1 Tax=Streptomyces longwoodensis TaxID=68231 RepID=A0A101QWP1_9ACTN|nr:hypothetical protein AQJ30_16790 [Streptomyces longwoodensis]